MAVRQPKEKQAAPCKLSLLHIANCAFVLQNPAAMQNVQDATKTPASPRPDPIASAPGALEHAAPPQYTSAPRAALARKPKTLACKP